jgi:hypothetical protein
MRIAMYIVGAILVAAGLAYVAHLMGVPQTWITVGVVITLGLGLMGAAQSAGTGRPVRTTPTEHTTDLV